MARAEKDDPLTHVPGTVPETFTIVRYGEAESWTKRVNCVEEVCSANSGEAEAEMLEFPTPIAGAPTGVTPVNGKLMTMAALTADVDPSWKSTSTATRLPARIYLATRVPFPTVIPVITGVYVCHFCQRWTMLTRLRLRRSYRLCSRK